MNKKADGGLMIIVIILALIGGVYIGNKIGLFSAIYPSGVPTELKQPQYANQWFYDTAVASGTSWECAKNTQVYFRTTDLDYGSGTAIAIGTPLVAYGMSAGACTTIYCDTINSEIASIPGGARIAKSGSDYCVCAPSVTTHVYSKRYTTSDPDASKVSLSTSTIESSKELAQISPIKDSGKYACENNNVVLKYCVYNGQTAFSSVIQDTCSIGLPCEFVLGQTVPEGTKDIVKCKGDYKIGLSICSSDGKSLHTTDSLGFLTTKLCGSNGYNVCSNGQCAVCKSGTSWCDGSKLMGCSSGQKTQLDDCTGIGISCSQSGTAPDTTATCSSSITDGTLSCNGNQPTKYSLAQRKYINNGIACRTSCVAGACTNDNGCTDNSKVKCDLGNFYKCDVASNGNQWQPYNGQSSNSQCISGQCASSTTCKPSYTKGYEYCSGNQRQKAVDDTTNNPLSGGIIKIDLSVNLCDIACSTSGTPQVSKCNQLSQCIGKEGLTICKDTINTGTCNPIGDLFTSTTNCQATNPKGYCNQPSSGSAFCDVQAKQCTGSYGCSVTDNKMYSCDSNGYFTTTESSCNNLGCELSDGNIASPINSQCKDECSTDTCVGSTSYKCEIKTVQDADSKQKVKSTTGITCNNGCEASTGKCISQCSGSQVCLNGKIYSCSGGSLGSKLTDCYSGLCDGDRCKDECNSVGSVQCISKNNAIYSTTCTQDTNGQKYYNIDLQCDQQGCSNITGKCNTACTPNQNFCSSGSIFQCTSSGTIGNKSYSCQSTQCNGNSCLDQCITLGSSTCLVENQQSYSGFCAQNTTTQEKYYIKELCGQEGCDSATGKCKSSGEPNSYICQNMQSDGFGGIIYKTDDKGRVINTIIDDCSKSKGDLKGFCVKGDSTCNYCIVGYKYCSGGNLQQCSDKYGTLTQIKTCEVQCTSDFKCDDLNVIVSPTQNGFYQEDLIISGKAVGSETSNGVETGFTATITKSGFTDTKTGSTSSDGTFSISFSGLDLGDYQTQISFPDYTNSKNNKIVKSKVSNDYQIKVYGSQTAFLIPSTTPTFIIQAIGNGKSPASLSVSDLGGLTSAKITATSIATQFKLEAKGDGGIYEVGIKPIEGTTALDEQKVSIELREPTLTLQTNIPSSSTKGAKQYDVTVLAPTATSTQTNLKPDSISLTINSNAVTLDDLGGGKYTFNYDFTTDGSYTILANAEKTGYSSGSLNKVVQISTSGTVAPPVNTTTTTTTGTVNETLKSLIDWKIVLAVAVVIFAGMYFFRKK